jgi:hypothetical protein
MAKTDRYRIGPARGLARASARDRKLRRMARITKWLTGASVVATVALSVGLANAVPGHSKTASPSPAPSGTATTSNTNPQTNATDPNAGFGPGLQPPPLPPIGGGGSGGGSGGGAAVTSGGS